MILAPTLYTRRACPQPCFFAEHDGEAVLLRGHGNYNTFRSLICADTASEVDAEIARLGLSATPLTKRQRARALFESFPAEVRAPFEPFMLALAALAPEVDLRPAVAALTVPPELQPYQEQLLALLA